MKVVVVIVAAIMLATAQGASVKCAKLCTGGAASCMTGNEATACQQTYRLSAMNACYQCGTTTGAVAAGKDASNTAIGGAAGGGKWWKPWNAGTCSTCVANCDTCASENTCAVNGCKQAYRLKDSKTCEACSKTHCLKCEANKDVCTACQAGYGLQAGACVKCNSHCNTCNTAAPKCDTNGCKENYARATGANNDGTCYSCATKTEGKNACTGAVTWTNNAASGLFNNPVAGTCTNCVSNCAVCATQNTCTTCKAGFTFKSADSKTCGACSISGCSDCSGDASKCQACLAGYHTSANKDKCFKCSAPSITSLTGSGSCTACTVANCKQCQTNGATCQVCNDGYIIDNNVCQKCIANCKVCTVAQSTKAGNAAANQQCSGNAPGNNNCDAGYFPEQKVAVPAVANLACISCGSNCVVCANQYQCQTCESGYHRDTAGKCVACKGDACDGGGVANGATTASSRHNTRWQTSVGRTCQACINGCSVGTATQNAWDGTCKCNNCVSTHWPFNSAGGALGAQNTNVPAGGSCQPCDANCNVCGAKDKCAINQCKSGFTNQGALAKCTACTIAGCTACPANAGTCTACGGTTPHLKNDGKACFSCPAGAVHKDNAAGTCVSCPTGCSGCSDATTCTGCSAGYVQNGNKCEPCTISNCATCLLASRTTKCSTCSGGYTKKTDETACYKCDATAAVFSDPNKGQCVSCNVANCASCSSTTTCNACKSGYVLDNNACHACGVKNCASCAFATRAITCTTCIGKYAKQNIANVVAGGQTNNCDALCDAHATTCGDAYTATACDTAKNYYLAGGRCVYCELKMTAGGTAAAGKATTAGNQYLSAGGICATCDGDADGCTNTNTPAACKSSGNTVAGGNCVAKCKTYESFGTFTGKCHSGCVSHVAGSGTVNGGALNGQLGGCYGQEGREAQLCSKGHHVQGATVGLCCNDDNAASGLVVGSVTLASVMTALYALM